MLSRPLQLAIVAALLLGGAVTAMALDTHGYRRWRQLGGEVATVESGNEKLALRIAALERKAEALRSDARTLEFRDHHDAAKPESQAIERAARENGYIRADETLFQLK